MATNSFKVNFLCCIRLGSPHRWADQWRIKSLQVTVIVTEDDLYLDFTNRNMSIKCRLKAQKIKFLEQTLALGLRIRMQAKTQAGPPVAQAPTPSHAEWTHSGQRIW
jgi:hypothetical protein